MSLRCPRCQKEHVALETFGVYRCPACGRIDADGHLLDGAAASTEAATFAAPPPKEYVLPGAPIDAPPPAASGSGPPAFFTTMLWLRGILIVVAAIASGAPLRYLPGLAFLVPLAFGREWARILAIVGATASVGMVVLFFALFRREMPLPVQVLLIVDVAVAIAWLVALLRADTAAWFARRR